jgi:hypothetical protein
VWPDVARSANANLRRPGIANVLVVGDGTEGVGRGQAPFDAAVEAAAFTSVRPPLADQLHHGGRLGRLASSEGWSCSWPQGSRWQYLARFSLREGRQRGVGLVVPLRGSIVEVPGAVAVRAREAWSGSRYLASSAAGRAAVASTTATTRSGMLQML